MNKFKRKLKDISPFHLGDNKYYAGENLEIKLRGISPFHARIHNDYTKERGKNHFKYSLPNTSVVVQGEGLGDLMIIRQFGRALEEYFVDFPDPELGKVVITTGGGPPAYNPDNGDINLHWWWSFGLYDDSPEMFLDNYIDKCSTQPDIMLCPSKKTEKEAQQAGFNTLRFPLGTYSFRPNSAERSGLGYAGNLSHKRPKKEERIVGPFIDEDEFEWVDYFAFPEELNLWYNTKLVTFGMHKEGQRTWGMVNNRVFETLASGTPFILESHPSVNKILGFDYPYQTNSREETIKMVKKVKNNRREVRKEFEEYSKIVRQKHDYKRRVDTLFDELM